MNTMNTIAAEQQERLGTGKIIYFPEKTKEKEAKEQAESSTGRKESQRGKTFRQKFLRLIDFIKKYQIIQRLYQIDRGENEKDKTKVQNENEETKTEVQNESEETKKEVPNKNEVAKREMQEFAARIKNWVSEMDYNYYGEQLEKEDINAYNVIEVCVVLHFMKNGIEGKIIPIDYLIEVIRKRQECLNRRRKIEKDTKELILLAQQIRTTCQFEFLLMQEKNLLAQLEKISLVKKQKNTLWKMAKLAILEELQGKKLCPISKLDEERFIRCFIRRKKRAILYEIWSFFAS